jgi:hypothetical protein
MAFPRRNAALFLASVAGLCLPGVPGAAPAAFAEAAAPAAAGAGAATAELAAGVGGKVVAATRPLAAARIYLYRLGEGGFDKALTDEAGAFVFAGLPAGLYKVIVHKAGFVPAVVRLTRASAEARQFLDLELIAEDDVESTSREDFWSVRAEVPPDVLRDIQVSEIADAARLAGSGGNVFQSPSSGRVLAEMRAMTGVDRGLGGGEGHVTRGGVGIEGRVGSMRLGLDGDYWQLQPAASDSGAGATSMAGESSGLSLELAGEGDMLVRLTSRSNRLVDVRQIDSSPPLDVDFEHYRLSVSHSVGDRGRTDYSAQYTSESNFYRQGPMAPLGVPGQSRSWRLEGVYTTELDERSSLQAGLRYRYRESAHDAAEGPLGLAPVLDQQQQVDLYGRAGTRVGSSVLIEYGLYTGLSDGSLSLTPRGGVVVQLSPEWQAEVMAAHEVHEDAPDDYRRFTPTYLAPHLSSDPCSDNEQSCYRMLLTHGQAGDDTFSFGASHRRFDEVQRLDFSEDLADRHESLYLVPGDELPEIEVAVSRRLSPRILATLQSNLASGGGGVFYATERSAYENSVRYLVTSLDTHFDGTSTGLFVAFHHLRQDLQVLGSRPVDRARQLEVERLELMLTQDLNVLLGLAADMAVQLNMQISRGSSPLAGGADEDELRRRLMGGIALRF